MAREGWRGAGFLELGKDQSFGMGKMKTRGKKRQKKKSGKGSLRIKDSPSWLMHLILDVLQCVKY